MSQAALSCHVSGSFSLVSHAKWQKVAGGLLKEHVRLLSSGLAAVAEAIRDTLKADCIGQRYTVGRLDKG